MAKKILIFTFILLFILVILIARFNTGLKVIGILSTSMEPLCPRGAVAFVLTNYYPRHLSRFPDVVTFAPAGIEMGEFVSRQVAGPNQKVAIRDNVFYINDYPYDKTITPPGINWPNGKELLIRDGYVFLLNDNRLKTSDSRDVGPIPKDKITGKVTRCLVNPSFGEVLFYRIVDSNYLFNLLSPEAKGF